jgi:hypothetical protein
LVTDQQARRRFVVELVMLGVSALKIVGWFRRPLRGTLAPNSVHARPSDTSRCSSRLRILIELVLRFQIASRDKAFAHKGCRGFFEVDTAHRCKSTECLAFIGGEPNNDEAIKNDYAVLVCPLSVKRH